MVNQAKDEPGTHRHEQKTTQHRPSRKRFPLGNFGNSGSMSCASSALSSLLTDVLTSLTITSPLPISSLLSPDCAERLGLNREQILHRLMTLVFVFARDFGNIRSNVPHLGASPESGCGSALIRLANVSTPNRRERRLASSISKITTPKLKNIVRTSTRSPFRLFRRI